MDLELENIEFFLLLILLLEELIFNKYHLLLIMIYLGIEKYIFIELEEVGVLEEKV